MVQWIINAQPKPNDIKLPETIELCHDKDDKDNKDDKNSNNDKDDEHEISSFGFFFCAFMITLGLLFNKFTCETLQPLIISKPINTNHDSWESPRAPNELFVNLLIGSLELYLNFIIAIVKPIFLIIPKCEIPPLVSIFIFNLMIILSAMLPKITTDQCKKVGEMMERRLLQASYTSPMVSV